MRIYELLKSIKFKKVWSEFIKLYGTDDEGIHINKVNKKKYKRFYKSLSKLKPTTITGEVVNIYEVRSCFNNFCDCYVDIYGVFPDQPDTRYDIEFREWDEVISMEYFLGQKLEGVPYSNEEFLAALLYEVEACSFGQSITAREILDALEEW